MRKRPLSTERALQMRVPDLSGVLAGLLLAMTTAAQASPIRGKTTLTENGIADGRDRVLGDLDRAADPRLELALEEAIALAIERNLDLVVERYRYRQAVEGIREARGIFDFQIRFEPGFRENSRPTTSLLEDPEDDSVTTENWTGNVNLSQLLGYSGEVGLGFGNNRSSSTDRNTQPNPAFDLDLTLSYRQPLLRGFGSTLTQQNILVARSRSEVSREELRIQVEQTVQRVINSYWNLVEARNQLEVAEESLKLTSTLR